MKAIIISLLLLSIVPATAQTGAGAFWRSLLIPGWGQRYAGQSGGRFIATEFAFWSAYLVFDRLSEVRTDRFQAYAAEHAGARPDGKERGYLDDLGFYESRLAHNQFALYQDGPKAQLYPTGADFFWEWDRDASRERYRDLRNSSESAKRQALYATGMVVANHLVAAIHAARSMGRSGTAVQGPNVQASFQPLRGGLKLALMRRF